MSISDVTTVLEQHKLVPVIKIERVSDAAPLAQALIKGGLPIAEITFRTEAAAGAIQAITEAYPTMSVGAGTVLNIDNVKSAVDAGASFIVAPGFNPTVVDYCLAHDIPVIPGVNSPTQIEMGLERGLTLLKFFPAEASGGLNMLKAVSAPYGNVRFMPTGGINVDNILSYLSTKSVVACGGTWIANPEAITAGKFDEIVTITQHAVDLIASAKIANVS